MSKILIVEDNLMNMVLVKDILTINGFTVLEAATGNEAIEKAGSENPDLILMDINLPEMDGITAMREIKANIKTSKIPVLALTASVMIEDRERIMSAGFDGFIPKPVDIEELIMLVKKYLSR
ncbi:MAG: response regulator [Deltaproteobacteria bacterium]|nr:response regulator [Deltaproteobacteria bacterium]